MTALATDGILPGSSPAPAAISSAPAAISRAPAAISRAPAAIFRARAAALVGDLEPLGRLPVQSPRAGLPV